MLTAFSSRAAAMMQQLQASIAGTGTGTVLQRLLSFKSATTAAHEEKQPPPPAPTEPAAAKATTHSPLQVESGGDGPPDTAREDDTKRVGKTVQGVALFLATASLGLMMTQPVQPAERSRRLFDTYTTLVYLTLCTGIGLSMYSILAPKSPKAAWFQKRLMVTGLGLMAAVFVLRTCIVLPIKSLTFVWVLFLLISVVIFLALWFAWSKSFGPPTIQDPGDIV